MPSIHKLTGAALSDPQASKSLSAAQQEALIAKVMQKHTWPALAERLRLPGHAAVLQVLRSAVRSLLRHYHG